MSNSTARWHDPETIAFYANSRKRYEELYPSERHFLTEAFLRSQESFLDIGCAVGGMSQIVQSCNPGLRYTGLDVVAPMIELATKFYAAENTRFHHYGGSTIPLDERFDIVFSSGVMHMVENWKTLIADALLHCKAHLLFDVRLTKRPSYRGVYHENGTQIPYFVINADEFLDFIDSFDSVAKCELYGYAITPNAQTEGLEAEVFALFAKLSLGPIRGSHREILFANPQTEAFFASS